jgi:anti-sigma regulatory factor (Ser/Thr protein kinase)
LSAPPWLTVEATRDVETARRLAREVAVEQGLDRVAAEEVVLVVSELATNLVRYARGGELLVRALQPVGVEVLSRDRGPGIADLEVAQRDGHSTGGGLGLGLGAVGRLMDSCEIESGPDGTRVTARKLPSRR